MIFTSKQHVKHLVAGPNKQQLPSNYKFEYGVILLQGVNSHIRLSVKELSLMILTKEDNSKN